MVKTPTRLQYFLLFLLLLFLSGVHAQEEKSKTPSYKTVAFWGQIAVIILLVILSGIVAGLTLGLMSQDSTHLAILAAAGTPKQRDYASRILPIRKRGHLLLTSLLLTNTVLNETLPVLCDELFGKGFMAVIISTVLIVLFSEVLPQAVCSRHGLAIGAIFALPVRLLMGFWFIIAWPISKVLDYLLGPHQGLKYTIPELRELIGLHSETAPTPQNKDAHTAPGLIAHDLVTLIQNTLDLSQKSAGQLALPYNRIYMLHADTLLDKEMTAKILLRGGSCGIPVYEEAMNNDLHQQRHIIGVLNTQHLAFIDPNDPMPLRKIALSPIRHVPSTLPAITLLKLLYTDKNQLVQVDDVHCRDTITNEKEAAKAMTLPNASIEDPTPASSPMLGIVTFQELVYQMLCEHDNCGESELGVRTASSTARTSISSTNIPDTPSVNEDQQDKDSTKIYIENYNDHPTDRRNTPDDSSGGATLS